MSRATLENGPMTMDEAIAAISFIMQECSVMGANDSEMPELSRLIGDVRNGRIDPAKAVSQAESIKESKMDYH